VPTTRILLARHGETEWNRVGRWQGHADPPLNDTGRRQAETLGGQLEGDGIDGRDRIGAGDGEPFPALDSEADDNDSHS